MPLLNRVISSLRSRGLTGTYRYLAYQWRERRWERKLGIETSRFTDTRQIMGRDDAEAYEPTDFQHIEMMMERLNIRPEQEVVVDIGSGKGRFLAIAAMRPFQKVIGVELDPQLVEKSKENLARLKPLLKAKSVIIECGDAGEYQVPRDVTVVYLSNPVYDETFARMIANIRESYAANPRDLTIIYLHPVIHRDKLADLDWLDFFHEIDTRPRTHLRIRFYRVNRTLADSASQFANIDKEC